MGQSFWFEWEVRLIEWLQTSFGEAGAVMAGLITNFGEALPLVGILGFFYWCYDKRVARVIGTALLSGLVFGCEIKNIVYRRRPYFDHPGVRNLKPVAKGADIHNIAEQGFSCPSGHSTNAASVYGSLAAVHPRRWTRILAVAASLLVGVSRVMLGVHYPTDVLAGWALGAGCAALVWWMFSRIRREWVIYLVLLAAGLPGVFYCRSSDYFSTYGLMIGAFAAFWVEDRFIRFVIPQSWGRRLLRLAGGLAAFGLANFLLGRVLPADAGWRLVRYALSIFLSVGVYPAVFRDKKSA